MGKKAAEGVGIGGAIGRTIGGTIGVIAAAVVAGVGAGAAGGGPIGALVGWNMPEEHVKDYEEGIKKGGILMGVRVKNPEDAEHFESSWKANSGQYIYR